MRDAIFRGMSRYSEFERSLGIAPNILSSRLGTFLAVGLMELSPINEDSERAAYVLTEKGRDLGAVVVALTAWGDRWEAPHGPPIIYQHQGCGATVSQAIHCQSCGVELSADDLVIARGPGGR
jgi:DNA-binding HxlR family transcriptional regulator